MPIETTGVYIVISDWTWRQPIWLSHDAFVRKVGEQPSPFTQAKESEISFQQTRGFGGLVEPIERRGFRGRTGFVFRQVEARNAEFQVSGKLIPALLKAGRGWVAYRAKSSGKESSDGFA